MRTNKKCNRDECAIKLDMNKVYDRVEWEFLIETLKKMGFSEKWCK